MKFLLLMGIRMSFTTLILALSFSYPAVAGLGDQHSTGKEVDGIFVELVINDEVVKTGTSNILIRLEDDHHQPVQGSTVTVILVAGGHIEDDRHDEGDEDSHDEAQSGNHKKNTQDNHSSDQDVHQDDPAEIILKATHSPGEYEGKLTFPAAGEWLVNVSFIVDGHEREVAFPLEVLPGGAPWLVLGSFIGINSSIIATAAVMRKRHPQKKKETH